MGIRFSILGFSQQEVCNIRKTIIKDGKEKELRLDLSDLLILRQIADFPNRKGVIKETINGEIFYWMSYKQVLSELPILNIKKQAFVDRVDKLVALGLVCREYVDKGEYNNMTFLRIGGNYESLLYSNTTGYGSEVQEGMVVKYKRGYGSQVQVIDNNKDNNRKENREVKDTLTLPFSSPKFEELWNELRTMPKWRKKTANALQMNLNKLGRFDEQFAIELMENAIAGDYQGVVFQDTERRYEEWKAKKNGRFQTGYRQERPKEEKSNFRYMMDMLNEINGVKEDNIDEQ